MAAQDTPECLPSSASVLGYSTGTKVEGQMELVQPNNASNSDRARDRVTRTARIRLGRAGDRGRGVHGCPSVRVRCA